MVRLANFGDLSVLVMKLIGGKHPYAVDVFTEYNVNQMINNEERFLTVHGKCTKAVLEIGCKNIFISINGSKQVFPMELAKG